MSRAASFAFIVDDDAMILMDACSSLKDASFRCYEAGTANELVLVLA
jgi:hypothetical protein